MSPVAQWVAQFAGAAVPRWLLWAAVLAAGAVGGAWLAGLVWGAELAELRRTHAEQTEKSERAARTALQAAQTRGDELTRQLHAANLAAILVQEQLDEQIRQATTGRRCLDGAALRLLDRAPGIAPAGVPAPARQPAAAHGAHAGADAPHPGAPAVDAAATDTQVALWARAAGGQYAECVRRLDALIDWHTTHTNTEP